MTREELARHDGREGRKAYVAVKGTVYDFTGSKLWPDGDHETVHQAGQDLTEELKSAPHVRAVIERFPVVGKLEKDQPQTSGGGAGKWIALAVVIIAVALLFLMLR